MMKNLLENELSDEMLDNVAGGTEYEGNYMIVSRDYYCSGWTCEVCHSSYRTFAWEHRCGDKGFKISCSDCEYFDYENWKGICRNPINQKK